MNTDGEIKIMRNEILAFMAKHDVQEAYCREIHNIGNEEFEEILEGVEDGDFPLYGVFEDEHHIQWDCTVSDIDWEKIHKLWIEEIL